MSKRDRDKLKVYCVYFNPSDYPNKYVLRIWHGLTPEEDCKVEDTLEKIRSHIPHGLVGFNRDEYNEDPCIFETWV